MADDRIQKLYDLAFQKWQDKDKAEAARLIDEALALSPNDLALNALAFHIKRTPPFSSEMVAHAERILDVDVHYRDAIDGTEAGRQFTRQLMLYYPLLILHAEDGALTDPLAGGTDKEDKAAAARRMCAYGTKLLQAGYGIPNLDNFLNAMASIGKHDVIIEIGKCRAGLKTSAEVGLPGLDHCEDYSSVFEPLEAQVAAAFANTGRNREALEWCQSAIASDPDNWYNYGVLGEIYCRLNQPAQGARQWIIAHQKGAHPELLESQFEALCKMVPDPEAAAKEALWNRIYQVKKTLPADRTGIAEKLMNDLYSSIGDSRCHIIEESYVTHKIEAELPALAPHHFNDYWDIWLPNQGPYPFAPALPPEEATTAEAEPSMEPSAVVPKAAPTALKTIESIGVDLTARARNGRLPPIVGRDKEIDSLVRILLRMEKNNPVLLGAAGVGKTAVLQGLAERIVAEDVPEHLRGRRVIEISMSALVGGTMWRGDFESRITNVIREARDNKDIILFIDELHTIMGAGAARQGELDAANIVKPALAKGELRLVGATTDEEYTRYIEKDPAMARRFTPVRVPELDRSATLEVLKGRRTFWRELHQVEIADDILALAVELTGLHVSHRRFPDKAIDLLDESGAFAKTHRVNDTGLPMTLTEGDVRHVLMEWTGAAGASASVDNGEGKIALPSRERITAALARRFVDQEAIMGALVDLVAQVRLSLKNLSRPLVALFHGPANAGKTTCVNALADALWPGESDRVLILNLSEHTDAAGLGRLVGAPPGYAGHEEPGLLTARLRRQPHSIVLLKNLGGADPQVTGFLTDALKNGAYADNRQGNPVSVADALFIVHVDTETLSRPVGFHNAPSFRNADEDDLVSRWLERRGLSLPLTHVIGFPALQTDAAAPVIRMHLNGLRDAYAKKGLHFTFPDALINQLAAALLELPVEKRDVAALVDKQVRPRIWRALLERSPESPSKELIIE